MDLAFRAKQLIKLFSYDNRVELEGTCLESRPFRFVQSGRGGEVARLQKELTNTGFCSLTDDCIDENKSFNYTVFVPSAAGNEEGKRSEAIILLHGLNERNWNKYLTWAEHLVKHTGKPVILFPIAFHMNRTPSIWYNPRSILPWVNERKQEVGDWGNSTFANLALSSRLSKQPLRFYVSGLESAYDILQLTREIKRGEHPLFSANASVNIFAYSIGALLAQVLLLANPERLFTDTRLFMFCGGSVFNQMNGNARDILDSEASVRLMDYYTHEFLKELAFTASDESISLEQAFRMMLCSDTLAEQRESFFQSACNRIQAISLKKDVVMPTQGIVKALGKASQKILEELDFPFPYSHQVPFPVDGHYSEPVGKAFRNVFDRAAAFL
jgi:pimeloyl-ACP methyl ester carboxylesterase